MDWPDVRGARGPLAGWDPTTMSSTYDSAAPPPKRFGRKASWALWDLVCGGEGLPAARGKVRAYKSLRLETLEERSLFSMDGPSALVSPDWFAEVDPTRAQEHAGSAAWSASTLDAGSSSGDERTDEYDWIVRFDAAALAGISSVAQTASLLVGGGIEFEALRGLGLVGQALVRSYGAPADAVQRWLDASPSVEHFERDVLQQLKAVPNDPSFGRLWGLDNTGQTGGRSDADIDAPEAWNISTGSASVVVGVIDTGVDYSHPDLRANMWRNPGEVAGNGVDDDHNGFVDDVYGYDFANNDADPMDDNSHGTHVAGTIGAVGNDGVGVAGVNWTSSIMALKFLSGTGSGYTSDAVRAVNYATMMRTRYGVNVRVTNNSWGGGGFSQSLADAVAASGSAGILFVAAAGNDGTNNDTSPHYPSNLSASNVLSVAATDSTDALATFSNYGATTVDLAAPGVSIYSTVPGNRYASYSGTSMATPHVAGVAALAWSVAPNATVAEVRNAILQGADRLASLQGKMVTGGRLNAASTLRLLGDTNGAPAIGSFAVSPNPATVGAVVTLTARGVADSNGTVTGVSFYEDANGDGQWDGSDRLLGSDASIVGGEASITLDTAGYAPGTRPLFVRAVDNESQWSVPLAAVLEVIPPDDHGNSAAAATPAALGATLAGSIERAGDVDWFAFDAAAGRSYAFHTHLGTLADSVLSLVDRDGRTVLASNDDSGGTLASAIAWTAPAAGRYYLVVSAYATSQTGSYTLTLGSQNGPPVLAAIANQKMSYRQDTLSVPLTVSDPDGDPLSCSARLVSADPALADAVRLSLSGSVLVIDPRAGFLGQFAVEVSASDGTSVVARTFSVSVTNDPPTLAPIANQVMSTRQDKITVGLSARDPDGDPLRYSAQVLVSDATAQKAWDLDQRYGLRYAGGYFYNYRGLKEKYVVGNGGQWFFILPNGEVHQFTGNVRRSPLVGKLSRTYYDNPSLLHDAQGGLLPSNVATVSVVGNQLVIDPNNKFKGTFYVRATVSDGTSSASQTFQVTVSSSVAVRSGSGIRALGPEDAAGSQLPALDDGLVDGLVEALAFDDSRATLDRESPGDVAAHRLGTTVGQRAEDRLETLAALMQDLGADDRDENLLSPEARDADWLSGVEDPLGLDSSWPDAHGGASRAPGGDEEAILNELYAQLDELGLSDLHRALPGDPRDSGDF